MKNKKRHSAISEEYIDGLKEIQIYRYEVNGQTILEIYINGEIRRIVLE